MTEGSDIIGRAAVEIIPDAEGFVARLRAQIEPGINGLGRDIGARLGDAAAASLISRLRASLREGLDDRTGPARQGERTAGYFADAFKARLKASFESLPKIQLDANATPADRKVQELRLKLKELADKKIGVDITDRDAIAEIERIKAELKLLTGKDQDISVAVNARSAIRELDALRDSVNGTSNAVNGGGIGRGGGLAAALVAALSLAGPLSAAAVGALGAVAGAAGTTALAVKGIQTEMKNGSVEGRAFSAEISGIKGAVSGLETTAAKAAGPGLFSALSQVRAELPTLNPLVKTLASQLGSAFSIGTGGLIKGLETSKPLLSDAGNYAIRLAQGLSDFAGSKKFTDFIDYSRQELPIVAHDLLDFGNAAVQTAVALQPIGDRLLSIIDSAARAETAVAKVVSFGTHNTTGTTGPNGTQAVGAGTTSGPFGGGNPSGFQKGGNAVVGFIKNLATGDTSDPGGYVKASQNRAKQQKASAAASAAQSKADQQQAAALEEATRQTNFNALAMQNTGLAQVVSTPAYTTATAAIKAQQVQLEATTAQMRIQNDVSGLLKQAEDDLSGKAYSAANAQNTFEQGIVSLLQNVKSGGAVFTGTTEAAITNRSSLLQLRDAAVAAAGTYGDVTVSGSKAQQKLSDLRQTIIDSTGTTGKARDAVAKYVDSILAIPSSASLTISAQTGSATSKIQNLVSQIAGVAGHHYDVYFDAHATGAIPRGANQVSLNATGGYITGPGTATSDSIKARLSNGEFVIRASQTAKHRDLLERLNTPGFAAGGFVDLSGSGPVTLTPSKAKANAAGKAASKAASTLAAAQANIRFTTSLDLSKLTSSGTAAQITAAIRKLIVDVHTAAGKQLGSDALIPVLQSENGKLNALANQRVSLAAKLKSANASLAASRKAFSDESAQVAGSVAGIFNITNVDGPSTFGTANPAAFLANLRAEASQAQNNAAQLAQLRKLGLNKTLIQQLGEAGPGGFAATQSLATASKDQIAQVNSLYAAVQASSKAAGDQVAASLYQAGIDSATGYIRGLNSQLSGVNKAAAKLAATVVAQIRKSLGIHSPSVVMRQHGRYTGEGFALGLGDRMNMVASRGADLANAAVQPAQFGQGSAAAGSHQLAEHLHLHGEDPEAVANEVVRRQAMRISI